MAWNNTFNDVWLKEMEVLASKGDSRAKRILAYIEKHGLEQYARSRILYLNQNGRN